MWVYLRGGLRVDLCVILISMFTGSNTGITDIHVLTSARKPFLNCPCQPSVMHMVTYAVNIHERISRAPITAILLIRAEDNHPLAVFEPPYFDI